MKKVLLKMNKKVILYILIAFLLGGIVTVFAQYLGEIMIANQFKTMTYNVELEEIKTENTWGNYQVWIHNRESSNMPVAIRISFNECWSKEINEDTFLLSNLINNENTVIKEWTSTFTNDFVKKEDGWYYYKKTLKAQESIQILNSITKNVELINSSENSSAYQEYQYDLSFNMEAIQATQKAITKNWNRTVTVNGNSISW